MRCASHGRVGLEDFFGSFGDGAFGFTDVLFNDGVYGVAALFLIDFAEFGIVLLHLIFYIGVADALQHAVSERRSWEFAAGDDVELAVGRAFLRVVGACCRSRLTRDDISILHCNTQYPTPYADVNLRAMLTLRTRLGLRTGYSDHTRGIEVPVAAVALGAEIIEKHFTLDRNLPGPDHKASLTPDELKAMVSSIRNIEQALGSEEKAVSPSERGNIEIARKSIVAARDIKAGELLTEENITVKRPGNGISPMRWDEVVGTRARRDFPYDSLIEL